MTPLEQKVAAVDERDQAAAMDSGFEDACAEMGLDRAHAVGLAKVAQARLAEFRKIAEVAEPIGWPPEPIGSPPKPIGAPPAPMGAPKPIGAPPVAAPKPVGPADQSPGEFLGEVFKPVTDAVTSVKNVGEKASGDISGIRQTVDTTGKSVQNLAASTQKITDFWGSPTATAALVGGGGVAVASLAYLAWKASQDKKRQQ